MMYKTVAHREPPHPDRLYTGADGQSTRPRSIEWKETHHVAVAEFLLCLEHHTLCLVPRALLWSSRSNGQGKTIPSRVGRSNGKAHV